MIWRREGGGGGLYGGFPSNYLLDSTATQYANCRKAEDCAREGSALGFYFCLSRDIVAGNVDIDCTLEMSCNRVNGSTQPKRKGGMREGGVGAIFATNTYQKQPCLEPSGRRGASTTQRPVRAININSATATLHYT